MALLTTVGNAAIQGASTTLANTDVDKSASGDTLINTWSRHFFSTMY